MGRLDYKSPADKAKENRVINQQGNPDPKDESEESQMKILLDKFVIFMKEEKGYSIESAVDGEVYIVYREGPYKNRVEAIQAMLRKEGLNL